MRPRSLACPWTLPVQLVRCSIGRGIAAHNPGRKATAIPFPPSLQRKGEIKTGLRPNRKSVYNVLVSGRRILPWRVGQAGWATTGLPLFFRVNDLSLDAKEFEDRSTGKLLPVQYLAQETSRDADLSSGRGIGAFTFDQLLKESSDFLAGQFLGHVPLLYTQ